MTFPAQRLQCRPKSGDVRSGSIIIVNVSYPTVLDPVILYEAITSCEEQIMDGAMVHRRQLSPWSISSRSFFRTAL
jgi:hypothetical protein